MKKIILLFSIFVTSALFSQEKGVTDRFLVDIFHDDWLHNSETLKTKWFSTGASWLYMYDSPFENSKFGFAIGAGISAHNVSHNSFISVVNDSTGTYSTIDTYHDSLNIKRHKLSTNYFDLPIELRFRSNPDKKGNQFKISIGARVGYRFNIHSKTKNDITKNKAYYFPHISKWRYGIHARVGYQRWALFGYYQVSSLFEEGTADITINPISFGISYSLLE